MGTRAELVSTVGERYRQSSKPDRTLILDEFVAVTGYHRKHAVRLLASSVKTQDRRLRRASCRYGAEIREALIVLWETSDRVCSKRLKPMIPALLPALERHGQLTTDADTKALLLAVSPATIDRLLSEVRLAARGGRRRRAGFSSAVRRSVPVRTFGDWNDPAAGFLEVDFVAHAGTSAKGSFVQTLVLTDIATGWTECVPVVTRSSGLVIEALMVARMLFPFPLQGVDFDNDGTFMNDQVVDWCRAQSWEVTRSRAYRKNDQAWVEQKNGAIVRRLVGYGRFEGLAATRPLARLYAAARLHTNLFQPSFKLKEKKRVGAQVIKRYHPPVPPALRVLERVDVTEASKSKLRLLLATADPVQLLTEIRAAQKDLGARVDRRGNDTSVSPVITVSRPADLKPMWQKGEQRPTHRRPYHRRQPWPKRPSMLDPVKEQIDGWLATEPGISAEEVLTRLRCAEPSRFTCKHRRTVQRYVQAWRTKHARNLILNGISIEKNILVGSRESLLDPALAHPQHAGSPTWIHSDLPRIDAPDS